MHSYIPNILLDAIIWLVSQFMERTKAIHSFQWHFNPFLKHHPVACCLCFPWRWSLYLLVVNFQLGWLTFDVPAESVCGAASFWEIYSDCLFHLNYHTILHILSYRYLQRFCHSLLNCLSWKSQSHWERVLIQTMHINSTMRVSD